MKVQIQLVDEKGKIVFAIVKDAHMPFVHRAPYDNPYVSDIYNLFAFAYQPTVAIRQIPVQEPTNVARLG